MSRSEEQLVHALSPVCEALGVRIYDVELVTGALRVTVERDGGLDLDAVSEVARTLSSFLDEHGELAPAGRYELEVGTPGVERRLRTPRHLAGALGETVALRLRSGVEGPRRLGGILQEASEDEVVVALEDGTTAQVALGDIERARTVFDWRRAFAENNQERRADGRPGVRDETERKVASS